MTEPSGPSDFINDVDTLLPAQPLLVSRLHVEEVSALIEALGLAAPPDQVDRVIAAVEKIVRDHEHEVFDDALERGDPVDLYVRFGRKVEDVHLPPTEEDE